MTEGKESNRWFEANGKKGDEIWMTFFMFVNVVYTTIVCVWWNARLKTSTMFK
jgi:hypothetical protein